MNTRIRRLAIGLLVCYLALFVQLNILQVGREEELTSDPRNDRQTIRDFNRPRGPIITADGVVLALSEPVDDPGAELEYQRVYPKGSLFGNVTGYYTFAFGSTQVEKQHSDVLAGTTSQQQIKGLSDLFSGQDLSGSVRAQPCATDVQQVAADALAESRGLGRRARAEHRRRDRDVQLPHLRPEPGRGAQRPGSHRRVRLPQRLPGQAAAGEHVPGAVHARVELQGDHHRIALENGVTSLERSWPSETEWVPPQTTDPIQNYGGTSCGGTMVEVFFRSCNIPVRPDGRRARARAHGRRHPGVGHRRADPDRPARLGRQLLRRGRRLHRPAAAARHRRLRPGQRRDGADAHGDGRRAPSRTAGR